jgi:hypothetical protein
MPDHGDSPVTTTVTLLSPPTLYNWPAPPFAGSEEAIAMQTTQPPDTNPPPVAPSRSRRATPVAAAIASLALLAAGCGSSSPSSSGTGSPATFTAAAFKYSSCMREHGLSSFPDPTMTDHNGQQVAYLAVTIPADPSPAFKSAQNACRGILPRPNDVSPTQRAQQQHTREQDLLAFAKCLRSHGIAGFPDPTSQGQLTLEMIRAAGVDLRAPAVLTAARACVGTANGVITGADVERAVNGTQ